MIPETGRPAAALLLCLLASPAPSIAQESKRATTRASDLRSQLAEQVPSLLQEHDGVGIAVGVVRAGAVAFTDGYGIADQESGRAVGPDTVFNVGSISKVVTGWGVMRLVEEELLDLDRPVSQFLTRWRFAESEFDSEQVTIRRLMSHTAGLNMHSIPGFEVPDPLPEIEEILAGEYDDSVYTNEGTPVQLISEPGAVWRYSGGGTCILQLLVEEVLPADAFAESMRAEVLEPLQMHASRFGWRESLTDRAAVPYDPDGNPHSTYRFTGSSGAGFYSTAADMARFVAAGLNGPHHEAGRGVLSAETIARMHEPVPLNDGSPSRCGLAYFVDPAHGDVPLTVQHGGSNAGWRAHLVAEPTSGNGLIVLSNSDNSGPILAAIQCLWGQADLGVRLPACN